MPTLDNLRHEAFAQARAKGARLDALLKAARLALLDAARLHGGVVDGRRHDQYDIIDEFSSQTRAAAKVPA